VVGDGHPRQMIISRLFRKGKRETELGLRLDQLRPPGSSGGLLVLGVAAGYLIQSQASYWGHRCCIILPVQRLLPPRS
jgi:hypothetical protein